LDPEFLRISSPDSVTLTAASFGVNSASLNSSAGAGLRY
jgi:hypothetical protein